MDCTQAGSSSRRFLIGIALSATTLGIVIPILKDAGQVATPFGQLVVAGASIAEIASIILLSLFFSGEAGGIGVKLLLLGLFGLFVLAVGVAVLGVEHSMRISAALVRLQDTTAEIRIRASFLLLVLFAVLADRLGLEAILGAFLAGAIVKLVDRDQTMTHPEFRQKLEAVGYGVFVPVFFVATGVRFELNALFASPTNLARVPIFLTALFIARGLPALVYRSLTTRTQTLAAALLQATSLSFLVVAGQIGVATRSSPPRRLRGACRSRPPVGGALPGDGPDAAPLGSERAATSPRRRGRQPGTLAAGPPAPHRRHTGCGEDSTSTGRQPA